MGVEIEKAIQEEKYYKDKKDCEIEYNKKIAEIGKALKKNGFPIDLFKTKQEKKCLTWLKREIEKEKVNIEEENKKIWNNFEENKYNHYDNFKIYNRTNSVLQVLNMMSNNSNVVRDISKRLEIKIDSKFTKRIANDESIKFYREKIKPVIINESSTIEDYIQVVNIIKERVKTEMNGDLLTLINREMIIKTHKKIKSIVEEKIKMIHNPVILEKILLKIETKIEENLSLGKQYLKEAKMELSEEEILRATHEWLINLFEIKFKYNKKYEIINKIILNSVEDERIFNLLTSGKKDQINEKYLEEKERFNIEIERKLELELEKYEQKKDISYRIEYSEEYLEAYEEKMNVECCDEILNLIGVTKEDNYFYMKDLEFIMKMSNYFMENPKTDRCLRICYFVLNKYKNLSGQKGINNLKKFLEIDEEDIISATENGHKIHDELEKRREIRILISELIKKTLFLENTKAYVLKKRIECAIMDSLLKFTSSFLPYQQMEQLSKLLIDINEVIEFINEDKIKENSNFSSIQ